MAMGIIATKSNYYTTLSYNILLYSKLQKNKTKSDEHLGIF
jgi:hypothetical protein